VSEVLYNRDKNSWWDMEKPMAESAGGISVTSNKKGGPMGPPFLDDYR
jgi:hypothetical protein